MSSDALNRGCAINAATHALMKNGMYESLIPRDTEFVVQARPRAHELGRVDVVHREDVRHRAPRLLHRLRDSAPQAAQRLDAVFTQPAQGPRAPVASAAAGVAPDAGAAGGSLAAARACPRSANRSTSARVI